MESGVKRAFYLGRYNCVERLGEGPLGETWRAKVYGVAGFEKQFAVKRLHSRLCEDEAFVASFVKVASTFASLDHDRIARVHEVNVQGAQYYVASDLVRGVDLAKLIEALGQRGEAFSPDAAMLIALEVAEALGHAHARHDLAQGGVVHCGLAPRSVMVTHEGEVRVLDVGLDAPLVKPSWATAPEVASTRPYLAPEVLRGSGHDARADVFSLGALLHEWLAGEPPFGGKTVEEILAKMSKPAAAPRCDPRLQAALSRMLQPSPERRLPSMSAVREQLVPILASRANRARSDLAAVVNRVARPERKTGSFPVVAVASMPPPPPLAAEAPSGSTSPTEKARRAPAPRGAQLSNEPMRNTLAGTGADDAVLPLELVELPGTPTVPSLDAVGATSLDQGLATGAGSAVSHRDDEAPTQPIDRIDREAPTAKVEKASPPPENHETERFVRSTAGSKPNGKGLHHDVGETGTSDGSSARTLPRRPIPADPKRFPSLAAEDAREETESDARGQTLPSMQVPPSVDASGNAVARGGSSAVAPSAASAAPESDAVALRPATMPSASGSLATAASGSLATASTSAPLAAPSGSGPSARPDGPSALPNASGRASGTFVPPPLGLPPVSEPRPWLLVLGLAVFVAAGVAGLLYFFYWREGTVTVPAAGAPVASTPPVVPGGSTLERSPAQPPAPGPALVVPPSGSSPPPTAPSPPPTAPPSTGGAPAGATPSSGLRAQQEPASSAVVVGPADAAPSGNVDVVTTPAGASIYVDGEQRGESPLRLQLSPGAHRLVAMLDGVRLRRESVRVGQGLTQVNLTMEVPVLSPEVGGSSGLKVRCAKTHGELRILVDGEDTGRHCPNEMRISVKPGVHRIGLYSPRTDQTVEVEKDIADDGDHSTRVYLKY